MQLSIVRKKQDLRKTYGTFNWFLLHSDLNCNNVEPAWDQGQRKPAWAERARAIRSHQQLLCC